MDIGQEVSVISVSMALHSFEFIGNVLIETDSNHRIESRKKT